MKKSFYLLLIFSLLIVAFSPAQTTVMDIDGNTYKTVIIGQQEWMAEELRTTKFTDGTPIQEYKYYDETIWENKEEYWNWVEESKITQQPHYRKDGQRYIYNERLKLSRQNLCPKGWRMPTKDDWNLLFENLGGSDIAGLSLRSNTAWPEGSNGTNESGFNATPLKIDGFSEYCPSPNVVWWATSGYHIVYLCSELGHFEEKLDIKRARISYGGDGAMFDYACIRCIKE